MENAKKEGRALHLMGLLSDGGVHSHNSHIEGLLLMAKQQGVKDVYVHAFMDGRDTPPQKWKRLYRAARKLYENSWHWKNPNCKWQILCHGQRQKMGQSKASL